MDDRLLPSLLGLGLIRVPDGPQDRSNLIDLRGANDTPEEKEMMARAGDWKSQQEFREFIRLTGWPDNWEEGGSPNLLRRRNPDGSFDYQPAIPEDLFGADAADEIGRQPDEFLTTRTNRYPLRW